MPEAFKQYMRETFGVSAPLSPGRFESELAKRVGSPARRAPLLRAWRGYLGGGGLEGVRSFYQEVLRVPKGEALVYAMHLPYLEFYAKEVPSRVEGRVLEVGAFTGALVGYLQKVRPELSWHALEGVEEALELGRKRFPEVSWHLGWAAASPSVRPLGTPSGDPGKGWEVEAFDTLLLLSVFPEGYLGELESHLDPEAFWETFRFFPRMEAIARLLRPGGLLVYGHGPFLGKSLEGVEEGLRLLGFTQVERVGEGDYALILARRPEVLKKAPLLEREAQMESHAEVSAQGESWPKGRLVPSKGEQVEAAWAHLEVGAYQEALALLPEEAEGEVAYLRGRALFALGRYLEAEEALKRAGREEAEALRAWIWVERGEYQKALPRLEAQAFRGGRHRLYLGRAYLGLGRYADALRQLLESGLEEAEIYIHTALERIQERMERFAREGEWAEVSRRVEFLEDLDPAFLTKATLRLGLKAALLQGLWARARRYARRLADLEEAEGFLGLALSALQLRSAAEATGREGLKEVEPYLTEANVRAELPEALLLLGILREKEGRLLEALALLERAARRGEGEVAGLAYHRLAQVKRALGHPILEVLGDHKRAHAHRAYPPYALYQMAREALEAGAEVLARELLSRVKDAGLQEVEEKDLLGLVGLVERLEGPWEAFRLVYEATSRTPGAGLQLLGLAYRLSRAFPETEEAERVRGEYLAFLYREGRLEEAEALLLSELQSQPQALDTLFDLAELYERKGAWKEAAEVWQRALEVALYREKDLGLAKEILRNLIFLRPHDESLLLYLEELRGASSKVALLGEEAVSVPPKEELLEEGLPHFHGEHLLVVGGHTQLRSRLLPLLEARGLKVDWFDSDQQASGREALRRIQSRLEKVHGLMIVSSYVGHDLSEPVRAEAERLGVPVYIIPGRARGMTGFLRALAEFAPQVFKRALKGVQ